MYGNWDKRKWGEIWWIRPYFQGHLMKYALKMSLSAFFIRWSIWWLHRWYRRGLYELERICFIFFYKVKAWLTFQSLRWEVFEMPFFSKTMSSEVKSVKNESCSYSLREGFAPSGRKFSLLNLFPIAWIQNGQPSLPEQHGQWIKLLLLSCF